MALEDNAIKLIHNALVCAIKDYFKKLGFKKAILGLSGGIDSAVVAVLAQRALVQIMCCVCLCLLNSLVYILLMIQLHYAITPA
ncbi:MAG: hypothetical protein M0D57_19930 [Sphingobacteriales bacterium JAD_PAG50586_3]|nr:MAG: hypothetical protein M0D57_19930 [Sphingobacteriales bacterium JAD_PAG50586_3]